MHSRRKQSRIPVKLPIHVRHRDDAWTTFTKDLSIGGVLIEWCEQHPLAAGEIVQVQIQRASNAPVVVAKVLRANPGGIALRFVDETSP